MKISDSDYDPRKHNYYKKVIELGLTLPKDSSAECDVKHDEWCAASQGGYCNCDPVVTLRKPQ